VQVAVFADRVEIWNPGELPAPLTPERLRAPHGSIARNPRICEALFLTRYIEKYGTGTLMMVRLSKDARLPEPIFEQRGGEFAVTIGRDWLTMEVLDRLGLNDRQRRAVSEVKVRGRIGNTAYQRLTGATKKTASRDLEDLVVKGVLTRSGTTGRGTHYLLAGNGDLNGTKGTSTPRSVDPSEGDNKGTKGT
jgi:predicted HTH transcriptional regulator